MMLRVRDLGTTIHRIGGARNDLLTTMNLQLPVPDKLAYCHRWSTRSVAAGTGV